MHFFKATLFFAVLGALIKILLTEFSFYQCFLMPYSGYIFLLGLNAIIFKPLVFRILQKKAKKQITKLPATDKLVHKPKINVEYPESPLRKQINN